MKAFGPAFGHGVALFFALCATAQIWAAVPENGTVYRTLNLSALGLAGPISLNTRNVEQHFYFPVPHESALKDARVEIHGTYLHPFSESAAVTLLVNGTPVFTHRLPGGDKGPFLKMTDLNGATFSRGPTDEQGDAIDISLPLRDLRAQGGFLDVAVVLSSQVDATRCIDERGRGNELSIDPKATRLVYSFQSSSVQSIRSLLTTLPRQPAILLPQQGLNATQYAAALRLSQALSGMGLHPVFTVVPQVGNVIDTSLLVEAAKLGTIRIPQEMADAISLRRPYKIAQPVEVAVWLALRMMSTDGLAQAVIDPAQTRQALLNALQTADAKATLGKSMWQKLGLDVAENWLPQASLDKANVRIAMLAGQPVLALEGERMGQAADLINTTWRQIAGSRELALATATHSDKDSTLPHLHFAPNLPVQTVAERAEWLVPIPLNGLPQGKWPDSLDINLMAAPSGDGQAPVASVFMNDNLLTAIALRTDGEITRLRAHIPLYALRSNNQLRVEIRRRISSGHCSGAAQGFPVQLLPSSYLNLRDAPNAKEFFMLPGNFGHDSEVAVPARYLQDAVNTLPVVSSILRGLSVGNTDFKLVILGKPGFNPSHTFVAFESTLDSGTQQVVTGNGKLVVRNLRDHTVFDSTGLGSLAVLQLLQSGKQYGVSILTVDGTLPALRNPLELSTGNLAVADAEGVRLAVNLDDKENDWQLDEQNRGVMTFVQRYRIWFIVLGLALLSVLAVFGLRWHYRNRQLNA